MKLSRLLGGLCVALLVSACASGPKLAEVRSAIPTLKPDEGRIYFYRPNTMLGAAVQPAIHLDGQPVGDSKPGGFFFVDAKPGPKNVATSTEVEKKLSFVLEPGQTRYVRTVIGIGLFVGRVYPELVDNSVGEAELKDMSYIGKPLAR